MRITTNILVHKLSPHLRDLPIPSHRNETHTVLHLHPHLHHANTNGTVIATALGPRRTQHDTQDEPIWQQIREVLGHTNDDPGHWNYSPEWWGTQDGGWGRSEGQVVFSQHSAYNGLVEVTAHPASVGGFSSQMQGDREEWRVLRFNKTTRQSVARVSVSSSSSSFFSGPGSVEQQQQAAVEEQQQQQRNWLQDDEIAQVQPDCLAPDYLKSMVSVIAGLVGLQGWFPRAQSTSHYLRVLCIGLGGGSLPLFLHHHYPGMAIDVVEIDPVVVQAAIQAMGFPSSSSCANTMGKRLRVFTADAVDFIKQERNANDLYDLVCIDAFDGEDNVPGVLCSDEFACLLSKIVNPSQSVVLMNFHITDVRETGSRFVRAIPGSVCFTVNTQKQKNLTLAVVKGLHDNKDTVSNNTAEQVPLQGVEEMKERLKMAAVYVAHEVGMRFPAGNRSQRDFMLIT